VKQGTADSEVQWIGLDQVLCFYRGQSESMLSHAEEIYTLGTRINSKERVF